VNTYSYDSYGVILSQSETVAQPYKFAGVYYDSETALYKMGARYYDPSIGRFTQADPAQQNRIPSAENAYLPTDFNKYIYAGNNPVNSYDPTGYWRLSWKKLGAIILECCVDLPIVIMVPLLACGATLKSQA
jgi:RHS repeat-associated protein